MKKQKQVDLAATDESLVSAFVEAARRHGAASEASDYRTANRQYDIATAIDRELRRRGNAHARLISLLRHDDPWVRYWAAVSVVDTHRSEAEATLEKLTAARASPVLSLDVKLVLNEWKKSSG